jgi:hypothetical protein
VIIVPVSKLAPGSGVVIDGVGASFGAGGGAGGGGADGAGGCTLPPG